MEKFPESRNPLYREDIRNSNIEAGESLGVKSKAITEDPSLVPRINIIQFTNTCNSSSRGSYASGFHGHLYLQAHPHPYTHIVTKQNKTLKKKNSNTMQLKTKHTVLNTLR